jgi:hypothetical protein
MQWHAEIESSGICLVSHLLLCVYGESRADAAVFRTGIQTLLSRLRFGKALSRRRSGSIYGKFVQHDTYAGVVLICFCVCVRVCVKWTDAFVHSYIHG